MVSPGGKIEPQPSWMYVLPWDPASVGGVNEVINNMLPRTQPVLGFSPVLVVNSWRHPRPFLVTNAPFRTFRMRVAVPAGGARVMVGTLAKLPVTVARLAALIRDERVSVINLHFPDLSALSWIMASRCFRPRPRVVLAFHGLDAAHVMAARGLAKLCWRRLLHAADALVVCSARMRADFIRYGVPEGIIHVVDNGIDPALLAEKASEIPSSPLPQRYIVSVGTFEHKKGHDLLLQAFRRLAPRYPDLSLVIMGRRGDGSYLAELERKVDPAIAGRIVFLSDVKHVEAMRIVRRAALFVLASREEPFGISILEAAALGVPVIASDACGATIRIGPEFLAVARSEDEMSLAHEIDKMLSDPPGARDKARRLEAQVLGRFNWDRVLSAWPFRRA